MVCLCVSKCVCVYVMIPGLISCVPTLSVELNSPAFVTGRVRVCEHEHVCHTFPTVPGSNGLSTKPKQMPKNIPESGLIPFC